MLEPLGSCLDSKYVTEAWDRVVDIPASFLRSHYLIQENGPPHSKSFYLNRCSLYHASLSMNLRYKINFSFLRLLQ